MMYNYNKILLINYRGIESSSIEEILLWDKWVLELDIDDIIEYIANVYELDIKDIYNLHFLSDNEFLNIVLCIEKNEYGLKTYTGTDGELLTMFTIYNGKKDVFMDNIRNVSNLIDKFVIIRDIKINKIF